MISWVYTYVKTYQIIHFKYICNLLFVKYTSTKVFEQKRQHEENKTRAGRGKKRMNGKYEKKLKFID